MSGGGVRPPKEEEPDDDKGDEEKEDENPAKLPKRTAAKETATLNSPAVTMATVRVRVVRSPATEIRAAAKVPARATTPMARSKMAGRPPAKRTETAAKNLSAIIIPWTARRQSVSA